jgi:hypothetical protein
MRESEKTMDETMKRRVCVIAFWVFMAISPAHAAEEKTLAEKFPWTADIFFVVPGARVAREGCEQAARNAEDRVSVAVIVESRGLRIPLQGYYAGVSCVGPDGERMSFGVSK